MQTRYKIFILLFTITLAVGAATFIRSGNDSNAVLRFRAFPSNSTLNDFKHLLISLADGTSLWYGGMSLFAILMIGLVFRVARSGGSQGRGERLIELNPTKVPGKTLRSSDTAAGQGEVERVLRQELKRMEDLLEAKDSTITELEKNLSGKQQLLQNRSQELDAIKTKVEALKEQLADSRLAKARAENVLQQELKKIRVLQAKDSVITELENSLGLTQERLQSRVQELDGLKTEVNALTEQLTDLRLGKERAENVLQRELTKIEMLQAKESSLTELESENGLSGQVEALQSELNEKQELLRTRNKELKAARSNANALRERLNVLAAAKEQMENVLQQQLKQKTELLQAKDAAIRELQETVDLRIRALEEQLKEENLLEDRDAEMAALGSEANSEFASTREKAKGLLLQELQNRGELLQAKDAVVKELQEQLDATVDALENAHREVERLMQQRDAELPDQPTKMTAPSERKGLNTQLLELGAAKAQAAAYRRTDEGKRGLERTDSTLKEPGENSSGVHNQRVLLADKDQAGESEIDPGKN
ncbi:MAG TPA: hypothetical protein VEG60_03805 [Candidatus Binatia bacterium]|nr:hypothetical protein [Candidatus Binatia bacterium]